MKWNSLIIFSLLLMTACSQKGSNVELKVSSNFVFGGSQMQSISGGGLMVWGQSTTGESFGQAVENNDELKLTLKNGTWTFYAMAWDGSKYYTGSNNSNNDTPFGGVTRCGKSLQTNLDGNAVSVSLTVDTAGCASNDFLGTAVITSGEMPKLKMRFCSDLTNIASPAHVCTDDPSTANHKSYRAPVGSYRIKLNQFQNTTKLADGIKSMCVSADGLTGLPNLPAGGNGFPFKMTLEYYLTTTDCELSGTVIRGIQSLELPVGVAQATPGSKYFTDGTAHYQFVELTPAKVCAGRTSTDLGGHPFAAGDGSVVNPYVICSVPQWHAINDKKAFSSSYKLQAHLDFNPYSIGFNSTTLPTQRACLDLGTNFIPVGYGAANCPYPSTTMQWDNVTPFSGNFYGNGFSFKNLRLRAEKKTHMGLFAHIQGSGIKIEDFNIEKAEISGLARVGAITGEVEGLSGPTSITIKKITAKGLDVEARTETGPSDVGGLVGYLNQGTLSLVKILNSNIRGDSSQAGGGVGYAYNSNLERVSIEADIEAQSAQNPIDIGGVTGKTENSNLSWVKHEGGINTNATKVGGITGSAYNSSITNFYAISNIYSHNGTTDNFLGGVVGYWSASSKNYGPGYTFSYIQSPCNSGCRQGTHMGFISGAPVVPAMIYSLGTVNDTGALSPIGYPDPGQHSAFSLSTAMMPGVVTSLTDVGTDDWKVVNGKYPRFDFEDHPCSSSPTGTGTPSNPKPICTHADYLAIGNDATPLYYKMFGNIRLSNSPQTQYEITNFKGHLNGNGKAIISGASTYGTGLQQTSHINNLQGTISNLRIQGMQRYTYTATTASQPASVFVANNTGTLENITVWTYSKFKNYGAGLVGTNASTGKILNVRLNGVISGEEGLSALVFKNEGLIANSRVNAELKCTKTSAACEYMTALAFQNYGQIKKTETSLRINDDPGKVSTLVSHIVDQNFGLIEDVLVSEHSIFRLNYNTFGSNMNTAYYHHRANSNGGGLNGTLNRVANFGKILFNDLNPGISPSGFPTALTAIQTDAGTHNYVYRGGYSGKQLLENAPYTCSNASTLYISNWYSLANYSSWDSILNATYNAQAPASKKLFIELIKDSGEKEIHRVVEANSLSKEFVLVTPSCTPGKATLFWTDDMLVDSDNVTPMPEVLRYQDIGNSNFYGTAWNNVMWNANNPDHKSAMVNYFAYILGLSNQDPGHATWELDEDGELRIFDLD